MGRYLYLCKDFKKVNLPNVGPFRYDPLPATEHCILHRWQQEALGGQLQHGVNALQSYLGPLQLGSNGDNVSSFLISHNIVVNKDTKRCPIQSHLL